MHDVIIVGCGPAGGYLASQLDGLDVLVLEKERNVSLKDSGLVSTHFLEYMDEKDIVECYIDSMQAVSPGGKTFYLQSEEPFALLLKRKRFSYRLRMKARAKAQIKYERVRNATVTSQGVIVETPEAFHEAKMVVGCDGTLSDIRKSLGIEKPAMVPGIFTRSKKKLPYDEIKVFFNKFYSPDFFSWIIPQVNEYGIMTRIRPRENFEYFKKSLGFPEGELHSYMIPMGFTKSYSERALLIGEACGQTKPLTGGGIIFSMRAADIAADVIKEAVERQRFGPSFLSRYERRWKKEFSKEIRRQLFLRKIYRGLSNKDIDHLFGTFGSDVESMRDFDYDEITLSWKKFSKGKIVRYMLENLHVFNGN